MNIQEYIQFKYKGRPDWFIEECSSVDNMTRVNTILDIKQYLSGVHAITTRPTETYNAKSFEPRKIVLQYAKTILNFEVSYLMKHPVTITGDESMTKVLKTIYKKGKYDKIDFEILDKIAKYGNAYEYLYVDAGTIKSKLIVPEDSYPVYNHQNRMIAFVEHYMVEEVSYYTVYYEDKVEEFNNIQTGRLQKVGEYKNLSGLPIAYRNMNEMDVNYGRSDLEDLVSILDAMEDLVSKFTDSFYKHHNPIPVLIGQQLKGDKLNPAIVGQGLSLDDGADFKLVENRLDFHSFETIYKTLRQSLLDISHTPAVSVNSQDVSNLSEVSIKLLFSLADIKAGLNEKYIREGFEQRFEVIAKLLPLINITVSAEAVDSVGVVFTYSRPQNEKDIIENLKALREIHAISLDSILEHSPYTSNVTVEKERMANEKANEVVSAPAPVVNPVINPNG